MPEAGQRLLKLAEELEVRDRENADLRSDVDREGLRRLTVVSWRRKDLLDEQHHRDAVCGLKSDELTNFADRLLEQERQFRSEFDKGQQQWRC